MELETTQEFELWWAKHPINVQYLEGQMTGAMMMAWKEMAWQGWQAGYEQSVTDSFPPM